VNLSIQRVDRSLLKPLIDYCLAHGPVHDDSFLPGRDFRITAQYPAYLLWKDRQIVGAVVLMRTRRYLQIHKGRFSIFHSILDSRDAYTALLDAIRPHFRNLRSVFLFIPEIKHSTAAILCKLNFQIERYSYVLENKDTIPSEVQFPQGYSVHPLVVSDKLGIAQFAQCVNESFAELAGHTESTPKDIRTWFDDDCYLEGGLCLLMHEEQPVGTISIMTEREDPNSVEVMALGIIPAYRGKGLGRSLLRYARAFALTQGLHPIVLSVNAENEKALALYKVEGFETIDTMICYALDLS